MAIVSEDFQVTCGACPVQIEGRLTDGRWFYFHSRGERARLGAGATLDEAVDAVAFGTRGVRVERDLSHLGQYGAGHISIPEAHQLLIELAAELPDAESAEGTR